MRITIIAPRSRWNEIQKRLESLVQTKRLLVAFQEHRPLDEPGELKLESRGVPPDLYDNLLKLLHKKTGDDHEPAASPTLPQ